MKLFIQNLAAKKRQSLDWNSELPAPVPWPPGCRSGPSPETTILRFPSPALACPPSTQDDPLGSQVATTWGHWWSNHLPGHVLLERAPRRPLAPEAFCRALVTKSAPCPPHPGNPSPGPAHPQIQPLLSVSVIQAFLTVSLRHLRIFKKI